MGATSPVRAGAWPVPAADGRLWIWLLMTAPVLAACERVATQLVVVVRTDLAIPEEVDGISLRVEGEDGEVLDEWFPVGEGPDREAMPISFGVAPRNGDSARSLTVEAVATRGDPAQGGQTVARTRAKTGFVEHERLRLDMFVARRCRELTCDPSQTCRAEGCVDPVIDPGTLPNDGEAPSSPPECVPAGVLSTVQVLRSVQAVAVSGSTVVLADYALEVVDVTEPWAPAPLVTMMLDRTNVHDVDAAGDLAIAADQGFWVLDVLPPPEGVIPRGSVAAASLGYLALLDPTTALVTLGGVLFVYDLSDRNSPRSLGQQTVAAAALSDMAVAGSMAFVTYYYGVMAIDVADPAQPESLGSLALDSATCATAGVVGDFVLVACGQDGLRVVDASNPRALVEIDVPYWPAVRVAVRGSSVLVAALDQGLLVLDLREPASPELVASVDTTAPATAVAWSGGLAYVGTVEIVDQMGPAYLDIVDVSCFGP